MTRRATIALGALGAILIVTALVLQQRGTAPAPVAADAASAVPVAPAVFGPYIFRVRAQGRVGVPSGGDAKLAFAGTGIVARVDVRVGDAVKAGQALAHLDTAGIALDVAQARGEAAAAAASYGAGSVAARALTAAGARLAAARDRMRALGAGTAGAQSDREAALAAVRQSAAKLSADQRAAERAAQLYAGGVAARKDVEAAQAQLLFNRADADANRAKLASAGSNVGAAAAQARADVAQGESDVRAAQAQMVVAAAQAESARARYAAARRNLAVATLRAPADGVVSAILKHSGEAVDPTQAAVVVGPARTSDVSLTVVGDDARRIHPGDPVTMTLPDSGRAGRGRVRSVVPSVDPATQTTTVTVAGAPAGAVSGDAVEATIDVGQRYGIVIPTSAIIADPESGRSIVFVLERAAGGSERFVSRDVSVSHDDERRALIGAGLRAGERVAAQGAFDLLAPGGGGG